MLQNENRKDAKRIAALTEAEIFNEAKKKIEQAVKEKNSLGKEIKEEVMKEKPVQALQEEYMQKQFADMGMGDESFERSNQVDKKLKNISTQAMARVRTSDGQMARRETRGNVGGVLSPNRAASMNRADISAKAEENKKESTAQAAPEQKLASEALRQQAINERLMRYGQMKSAFQKQLERKMELRRDKEQLGAFGVGMLFIILVISVIADVSDLLINATGVGALISPLKSLVTGIVLSILWWSIGGEYRSKNLKRMLGGVGIDAIPFLNVLPSNIATFVWNVLNMSGVSKRFF